MAFHTGDFRLPTYPCGAFSRANPAPANPRPARPMNQRYGNMPQPTPEETLDRDMVIRCMQSGAIPVVQYTALDMDQLEIHIVRFLTGILTIFIDQDCQKFQL
jgi:hypothetical protein